ncbi:unnamed protein product [Penicillium roqueforti FM164]|uniref:Uncharacterized protein n=1 Tax=Penicillium roqueforti (strain FM164) TaxID=1365484 RepID=W6QKM1_PENRF|nr:unnamed protein product [Penicillium roqueforti FM164]
MRRSKESLVRVHYINSSTVFLVSGPAIPTSANETARSSTAQDAGHVVGSCTGSGIAGLIDPTGSALVVWNQGAGNEGKGNRGSNTE